MRPTDGRRDTWTRVAAIAAVAGGGCWLVKQGVIAATVPATGGPPPESVPIAVFYLAGAALMADRWQRPGGPRDGRVDGRAAGPVAAVVLSPCSSSGIYTPWTRSSTRSPGPDAGWWWPGEGGDRRSPGCCSRATAGLLATGGGPARSRRSRRAVARDGGGSPAQIPTPRSASQSCGVHRAAVHARRGGSRSAGAARSSSPRCRPSRSGRRRARSGRPRRRSSACGRRCGRCRRRPGCRRRCRSRTRGRP